MKTVLQIDLTFEQIISLVKQLPNQQKIELSEELEKDSTQSKISFLLKSFKTKELSEETIDKKVEIVRQKIYDNKED